MDQPKHAVSCGQALELQALREGLYADLHAEKETLEAEEELQRSGVLGASLKGIMAKAKKAVGGGSRAGGGRRSLLSHAATTAS